MSEILCMNSLEFNTPSCKNQCESCEREFMTPKERNETPLKQ